VRVRAVGRRERALAFQRTPLPQFSANSLVFYVHWQRHKMAAHILLLA